MTIYQIRSGGFCPMDRGLLQSGGELTIKLVSCSRCGKVYAVIPDGTEMPDGFIRPSQVVRHTKQLEDFETALTLRMTVSPQP